MYPVKEEADYTPFCDTANRDKALHTLKGLLKGVAIDHAVNTKELTEVRDWVIFHSSEVVRDPVIKGLVVTIQAALHDGILTSEEAEDIRALCDRAQSTSPYFSHCTHLIQELHGLMHGIIADMTVNTAELRGLLDWFDANGDEIRAYWPVTEVEGLLTKVMSDGKIDPAEHKMLLSFFSHFAELSINKTLNAVPESMVTKQEMMIPGICAVDPKIVFDNHTFCFTGRSSRGPRQVFANVVESKKGIFVDTMPVGLDYLIIGNGGNPCWAFACYGRKVEKAVQMRKAGQRLLLVHENDFWDAAL